MFRREVPFVKKKLLTVFIFIAAWAGIAFDYWAETNLDNWVHDSALIYQERSEWLYTAIVVLDDDVPITVGRKQALPLYALAADRLIAAGTKGIYLDSRVSKDLEGRMPFATCIGQKGEVQWSEPYCEVETLQQCSVKNSSAGNAPLRMSGETIIKFRIAPYLGQSELPDFLLYDFDAAMAIPTEGIVVSDRLVTKNDPIARWIDLSKDHAVVWLANQISPALTQASFANNAKDELCDNNRLCRRIRLSYPVLKPLETDKKLLIPVSRLASCNPDIGNKMAKLLKDKIVIFQMTAPTESTDIIITPITTALFGPKALMSGAQYLVDSVETLLNQDHPRRPDLYTRIILFFVVALVSVLTGAYLKQGMVWVMVIVVFSVVVALCFFNPIVQLWPLTAVMAVFLSGAGQTTSAHMLLGLRQGKLIGQYMPSQIHDLLLSLKGDQSFQNKRCFAVVLMSDLAGYTTVTSLLKEPSMVLRLMNDYLSETSIVLQKKYNGWFESYVGDMVCYYWPYDSKEEEFSVFKDVLQGALELSLLQKKFFSTVSSRYKDNVDADALAKIDSIIDAGIGLSAGPVVMGDLGPPKGIRKFGILGDPLNLASRIEGLTRFFNCEIIISSIFAEPAKDLGFAVRRVGDIKVKGRGDSEVMFALGYVDDPRFEKNDILAWETWLADMEDKQTSSNDCPGVYALDEATIVSWSEMGLLNDGVWYLESK